MMKKLISFACFVLLSTTTSAQISKASLQASGLTCALCAKSIYTNLTALPFVKEVDTDLNASAFLISFKDNADVDLDALAKKVEDAGFSVASLKFNLSSIPARVGNDQHVTVGSKVFHFLNLKNGKIAAETELRVIDQHFVSAKVFKKFSTMTKKECIKTGKAQHCCSADGIAAGTRIFHVTI